MCIQFQKFERTIYKLRCDKIYTERYEILIFNEFSSNLSAILFSLERCLASLTDLTTFAACVCQ